MASATRKSQLGGDRSESPNYRFSYLHGITVEVQNIIELSHSVQDSYTIMTSFAPRLSLWRSIDLLRESL